MLHDSSMLQFLCYTSTTKSTQMLFISSTVLRSGRLVTETITLEADDNGFLTKVMRVYLVHTNHKTTCLGV